jgi:hypothetical protein
MMTTARLFGIGFLIAFLALVPVLAQGVSVAGEWELTAGSHKGEMSWKVVFALEGEALDVTMTGPRGNEVKGKGTLKGDAIEWSVSVPTPRGEMDVAYKGIVAGDTMSGEVRRGNLGTAEWSAKRKAAPPSDAAPR